MSETLRPINIRVSFGSEQVVLSNDTDIKRTNDGTKIWLKHRPGGKYQVMAETDNKNIMFRPVILDADWVRP